MTGTAIPRATYRLQLTAKFGFRDAADLVPYLAALGVSHAYFSPYLKTRPGSEHGYDIVDHDSLNPELGGEADHVLLCDRLREHSLGQILDIVPNHIGIMGGNGKWWLRVLENGQASRYADYFDIDWRPVTPKLRGKVLVPVLGAQYGHVLTAGELVLRFDAASGEFNVHYYDHRLPVDPSTYPLIIEPGSERAARHGAAERTDFIELESVIRSLKALPSHESADDGDREVRAHEIFIAKRRLADLCARSAAVAEHIERAVRVHNGMPGKRASFESLHALLERQPYRLAFWRVAADEINYRRFFDVNDLAGLRTQNEELLEATHRKVLQLAAEGKADGFRIDHPDGLYDPLAYLKWLRGRLAERGRHDHYIVVEKILAAHEHVPRGWPVHGTTGYDFSFAVNGVFVCAPNEKEFGAVYTHFARERDSFDEQLARAKREIVSFHLSSELTVLANLLSRVAESRLDTRDFTLNAMRGALLELVVAFPVYRTYVTADHLGVQDRAHIEWAVENARQTYEGRDEGILELIKGLLLFDLPDDADLPYRNAVAHFTAKFQQLTGPVMAKAFEDTAFYRHVPLLSLNEVGGDPRRFGITIPAFHRLNELRLQHWPGSMLATSTHDSKRSEDVRARLNVLSEMSGEWRDRISKWRRFNRAKRGKLGAATVPSRTEEYLLYQTLVGTWPVVERAQEMQSYRERIEAYMVKALREAKVNTSWVNPRPDYEERVLAFVRDTLAENARNPFVEDLDELARSIARPGFLNSLGQTLLKLTCPGVPDTYQGNELWDFSLVDPDNRRPVDYALRRKLLAELEEEVADEKNLPALLQSLCDNIEDGRAKLYLTWRALHCRAELPKLFAEGAYVPLEVRGARAEHVCAFARRRDSSLVVTIVGRWFTSLGVAGWPRALLDWQDTSIVLPAAQYRNVLTGEALQCDGNAPASVGTALGRFPIALLRA